MAACKTWSTLLLFRDAAVESWLCRRKAVASKRFPLIPMMPTGKGDYFIRGPCWLLGLEAGMQRSPLC